MWCVFTALIVATSASASRADEKQAVERLAKRGVRIFRDPAGNAKHAIFPKWATNEDLALLKDCSQFEVLILGGTKITDDGLKNLVGLTRLNALWLADTKITDDGLKHLRMLRNMRWLDLHGTKIQGPGLQHLDGLIMLRRLELTSTAVKETGINRLLRVLPACEVIHDDRIISKLRRINQE